MGELSRRYSEIYQVLLAVPQKRYMRARATTLIDSVIRAETFKPQELSDAYREGLPDADIRANLAMDDPFETIVAYGSNGVPDYIAAERLPDAGELEKGLIATYNPLVYDHYLQTVAEKRRRVRRISIPVSPKDF